MKNEPFHIAGCLYAAAPWTNLTGAPICALEHLASLRPFADEVRLVLCEHGDLEGRARMAGVPAWCSPFVFRGLRQGGGRRFLRGIGAVVRSRWAYVRGLSRLLREKPGLLHIHSRAPHLPYALIAGWRANVPVVVTIHEPWEGGGEAWFDAWMIRWFASRVVFPAEAVARPYPAFLRRKSVVARYSAVIPPPRPPRPAQERPQVGMPGRLGHRKGFDVFLEVCRRLRDDGAVFEAWMGGGGWNSEAEHRQALEFLREHGLKSVVSDQDHLPSLEPLYERTDILLLTSRRDPLPRVIMEAMCRGIPVVATRVDGIPDMVADGVTGFLVAPEDSAGFAAAVGRLLRDPDLRQRMGAAGRERAKTLFAPEAYVGAMLDLYRGLRRKGGRTP